MAAAARLRAARKTHELLSNPGYINHLRALTTTAAAETVAACELSPRLNEPVDGAYRGTTIRCVRVRARFDQIARIEIGIVR